VVERFLVDKSGQVYSAFDEQFAAKFGYPMPDFDLPSYAVRNLGAVDIEFSGSQTVVRFRSLFVTTTALAATATLLLEQAQGPVTVQREDHGWREEIFASSAEAAAWLTEHGHGSQGSFRDVVTTPLSIAHLSERRLSRIEQPHDKLSLVFKKWRIMSGVFDREMTDFLVRHQLHDRTIIVSEEPSEKKLVFEHFGAGFTIFEDINPGWRFSLQGRPVAEQPDKEYAACIDIAYRKSLDERQPRFDHVDAVVRTPGSKPDRFIYDRLLLPCRGPDGQRVLVSTSYGEHLRSIDAGSQK